VAPGGTCHLPDGAKGFLTPSLKHEHALLRATRNPYLPAPLACCEEGRRVCSGVCLSYQGSWSVSSKHLACVFGLCERGCTAAQTLFSPSFQSTSQMPPAG